MPTKRKRGGQPDNRNAITHGRYSKERRMQRAAEAAEEQRKSAEWFKKMPQTDYGATVDELRRLRATAENAEMTSKRPLFH